MFGKLKPDLCKPQRVCGVASYIVSHTYGVVIGHSDRGHSSGVGTGEVVVGPRPNIGEAKIVSLISSTMEALRRKCFMQKYAWQRYPFVSGKWFVGFRVPLLFPHVARANHICPRYGFSTPDSLDVLDR